MTRWFYDCHTFTGDLQKYNFISIVWRYNNWAPIVDISAQTWVDTFGQNHQTGGQAIDIQFTNDVCIDYEAPLKFGSLECLDEPDWVFRRCIVFSCS